MNNKTTHIINTIILILCSLGAIGSVIALFLLNRATFENIFPVCILIPLLFAPYYLKILFKVRCSDWLCIFYYIFTTSSLVLGSGWRFYDSVKFYDIYLHATSGVLLSIVAYSMVYIYQERYSSKISLLLIFFFCIGFASFVGVIWEIIEYTLDSLMDTNMQIYQTPDGVVLYGHRALYDTMKDLMSNTVGAILTSLFLTLYSKRYNKVPATLSLTKIID